MVKSLLSLSQRNSNQEQELDINTILCDEIQLLERTTLAKVHLQMDLQPDLRLIRGEASDFSRAFMNIFVNALDAMPDKGRLSIRTRNADDQWIEVEIEDTGTGMPKEILGKAMDPFFTTKPMGKGTGLGLSMVYNTVKAHQGQIEVQSEPGQGTLVRMRFPVCAIGPRAPEPSQPPRSHSASLPLNVLFIDDDELIQSSTQALLGRLGHRVNPALSGEEALAKLEAGFHPDIVILDMNMPGLGGSGTLPCLRSLNPTVPVLIATGHVEQAALDLVTAFPHVTLLSKPYSLRELQQHLEIALAAPKTSILQIGEVIDREVHKLSIWTRNVFYSPRLCASVHLHREKIQRPCTNPIHLKNHHNAGWTFPDCIRLHGISGFQSTHAIQRHLKERGTSFILPCYSWHRPDDPSPL